MENGAILSNENHIWFHKQSESKQGYMDAIFQEYKRQVDKSKEVKIVFVDELEVPYKVEPMEIIIEEKKQEYNRAKKKEEDKQLIKEWEEER